MSNGQVERIRAKVSGEAGRNAANSIGTAGQAVHKPVRAAATNDPKKSMNSGDMSSPAIPNLKKVIRTSKLKLGSFDGIKFGKRNGQGGKYAGGTPSSKGGANMKGID